MEVSIPRPTNASLAPDLQAARAARELSEERPVIVGGEGGGDLVFAAEHINPQRLEALRSFGPPVLLLSPHRAETLRIRLYTEEAIAIALEPDWPARLVQALADPAKDLDYALHGPLAALREPLSEERRAAHRLVHMAGLLPASICVSLSADGLQHTQGLGYLSISAKDALAPVQVAEALARLVTSAHLPLAGEIPAQLIGFRLEGQSLWGGGEGWTHYALAIGRPAETPLVRLHSECFTGDFLGSLKCDCGEQLRGAIVRIAEEGGGFLIYLRQEGRGIGLLNKLRAYHLQDEGLDTVEANLRLGFADDERSYAPAASILEALGARRVRLLTNNPRKVEGLSAEGIEIAERVGHKFPANPHNAHYLATKKDKSGHLL